MKDATNMFINQHTKRILLQIDGKKSLTRIMRETDATYQCISEKVAYLKKFKLVTILKPNQRTSIPELTEKGSQVRDMILIISQFTK